MADTWVEEPELEKEEELAAFLHLVPCEEEVPHCPC